MIAILIFVLCACACGLMNLQRPTWAATTKRGHNRTKNKHRPSAPTAEALPRLIRQLASLLAAGRTGELLWESLAMVLTVEQTRIPEHARSPAKDDPHSLEQRTHLPTGLVHEQLEATLHLVLTVERASALDLPTATAIRNACTNGALKNNGHADGWGARRGGLGTEQTRMWLDIAACFDVCEASGAPIAEVLERLASSMEADHDAAALRETALAGPRATVKLLTWLPLLGLGLGMLMGVDPLAALLGSPLGWAVLLAGGVFAIVGRVWSGSMISHAAQTIGSSTGRRKTGKA